MKHIFSHSFATRLSIYVFSFTLIVFATIMALFYNYNHEKVTSYAIERTHGLLSNIATEISSQLMSVETTINQSTWVLERNINLPDALHLIIESVVKNNPLIVKSGIAFTPNYYKEKGKYFMPYASLDNKTNHVTYQVLGSQNYDYPCMDWYLIPKMQKQAYWSEPYYDDGGGNIIMSTYSKPLYDNRGELFAVFIASISLTQFTDTISLLKPYPSSYTYLISRNGSFLTHADRDKIMNETIFSEAFATENHSQEQIGREMLAGHTGTIRFDNQGNDSYAFYTTIPQIGWSVCTVCPSRIILQELDNTSRKIIYTFLGGILILLLIVYSIIRRLVRPLEKFSESAREIATGRFDVTLPLVRSNDEIKDLYDSLVYMQKSLSTYVNELKDDNHLYFLIGDVSGKGVPASLFMAITRSLFRTLSQHVLSPAKIVTEMNNSISDNNESNMFVTLIVGILDLETGILKLCNAGHNPPILIYPDGQVSYLEFKTQIFVGVVEDFKYSDEEVVLEKESKLFLYTDGVTEAENINKELYGEEKLLEMLSDNASSDVRTTVNVVVDSIASHVKEAEASDDLTILLIQYEPGTANS